MDIDKLLVLLIAILIFAVYLWGLYKTYYYRKPTTLGVEQIPPKVDIGDDILFLAEYGFDLPGGKDLLRRIKKGMNPDVAAVEIYTQKKFFGQYLSLTERDRGDYFWKNKDAFLPKVIRNEPGFIQEYPKIMLFIKMVRK